MISIVFFKKNANQIQIQYSNKLTPVAKFIAILYVYKTQWLLVRRCDNVIRRTACLLRTCKNKNDTLCLLNKNK